MKRLGTIAIPAAALLLAVVLNTACNDSGTQPAVESGRLIVNVAADYGAPAPLAKALDLCPPGEVSHDDPSMPAGVDCDQDGGVVAFNTPIGFKVAIKKLDFIRDDGEVLEIVPDSGTLAASDVLDLSAPVTLFTQEIPPGDYAFLEVEFYYYELTMHVNDPATEEQIRVYLSDDDFPAEGGLGHHQGDITIIGSDGLEAGWAQGCTAWNAANVQGDRTGIEGAGGADPETGHVRGFYGDAPHWNQADFMQGPDRDIFVQRGDLDLVVDGADRTVTITFDLVDTWFFEDFDANGLFNPGQGAEACSENSEWTPIFPEVDISVD